MLEFIKFSSDKNKMLQKAETDIISLDRASVSLLNAVTNVSFHMDEGEEEIMACKAIDDIREEGRIKGLEEGREEGAARILKSMKDSGMSIEEIARICKLDVNEVQKLSSLSV